MTGCMDACLEFSSSQKHPNLRNDMRCMEFTMQTDLPFNTGAKPIQLCL